MTSYAHFSNPYDSLAQQLPVTAAGLVTTPAAILSDAPHSAAIAAPVTGTAGSTGTPCCDTGRPVATDPVTGQVICSCQYDSGRLPVNTCAPRIPAVSAASPLAYGASTGSPLAYGASTGSPLTYGAAAYPSTEHNPYPSIGVDSAAYFSQFASPYSLKDAAIAGDMGVYGSIAGAPAYGYSPYEAPMYAAYTNPYELAARRKNATRESTNTLKAWLNEHKKNPYPTKGEKIMLAIITKMTLTQVSTWFANARRRLKKENKMTWEPRNRTDDDDDGDDDLSDKDEKLSEKDCKIGEPTYSSSTLSSSLPTKPVSRLAEDDGEEKPRIWSLAETASTTDPARLAGIQANWSTTAPVGQGLSPSLSLHSLYPHPQLLPSCTAATANIISSGDKHHFSSADHHTRQLSHQPASQHARLTPTCGSSSPPRSPAVSMRASSMLTGDTIINHATAPSLSPTATAPSLNPTGPKHFPSSTAVSIHGASAPFTASAPADRLTRLTTSEASFSPSAMTRLSATNIKPLVPSEPIPQAHASLSCTTGAPSTDSHLTAWSSYHQWKQHYASSAAVYGAAAAAVAASTPLPGHQLSTPTTLPALASSNALPHTVDQPRA